MNKSNIKSVEMGAVALHVKDLESMTKFYSEIVGLDVLAQNEKETILGHGNTEIIKLISKEGLEFPAHNDAGLYHTAILFDQKHLLAKTLKNAFEKSPDSFSGSGDHFVSQAFYFTDPEGNGLELYYDRPRSEWKWENGKIMMGSVYIDPEEFINHNVNDSGSTSNKKVGHVHLKVGDIGKAKEFYVNVLGFDIMAEMPSALFVSAGGYHHHLGMNVWESAEAEMRRETIGLGFFEVFLQNKEDLENLKARLVKAQIDFEESNNNLMAKDPWGNIVILKVAG